MKKRKRNLLAGKTAFRTESVLDGGGNEKFLTRQLAIYMERVLAGIKHMDAETLEFTCWVLDREHAGELCRRLSERLPVRWREGFEEDLDEADDVEDIGECMALYLKKCSGRNITGFCKDAAGVLHQRIAALQSPKKSRVEENMAALTYIFGLNDDEQALVRFLLAMTVFDEADTYFTGHLNCDKPFFRRHMAAILGMTEKRLNSALFGKLSRLEMIDVDGSSVALNDEFMEIIESPENMLTNQKAFVKAQDIDLPLEAHMVDPAHTRILRKLLERKPVSGAHVLFYGPPGTGKTSYARALVKEMGAPAYEIINNEENSSAVRRGALLSCIHYTGDGRGSVVIVDEADNMLNTRWSWSRSGETRDKGWVNNLLERPGLRIIWIVNHLSMDDSVCRRFAYSIQFHPFSRKQRISLWKSVLKRRGVTGRLTEKDVADFAVRCEVSAGGIDLAVRKAVETGLMDREALRRFLDQMLTSHVTLMNGGKSRPGRSGSPTAF